MVTGLSLSGFRKSNPCAITSLGKKNTIAKFRFRMNSGNCSDDMKLISTNATFGTDSTLSGLMVLLRGSPRVARQTPNPGLIDFIPLGYSFIVIAGEELAVVSGISEWARRVRELRVQFGWPILSGITAKQMAEEGEFPLPGVDVGKMKVDDYVLVAKTEDRDAAHRWNVANVIRREKGIGVREKILEYLKENVGKPVTGEELRYVANDKKEWARRVRELRTEQGWTVLTKPTGRPDLPVGVYVLESLRQLPAHDRNIPDDVRVAVLTRDNNRCTKGAWHRGMATHTEPTTTMEL